MKKNGISVFIDEPYISDFNIKVIGVGGGALNVLNRFQPQMNHRLEVIAIDPNQDSLSNSMFAKTFCLNNLVNKIGDNFETARRTPSQLGCNLLLK